MSHNAPTSGHEKLVQELLDMIKAKKWENDFASGIERAIAAAPVDLEKAHIKKGATNDETINYFLDFCDRYLRWVPYTTSARDEPLWVLSLFYFVFHQKGIVEKQTPIEPKYIGQHTELSLWLQKYARTLGTWMDTAASADIVSSFSENPEYTVYQYEKPTGGWKSYNAFFTRKVNPVYRPVAPNNTVASPCDAKFDGFWPITSDGVVELKGLKWPIQQLLKDIPADLVNKFHNGIFMHSFLLPNNYHRVHAPVSGTVKHREKIPGDVYLEVTADPETGKLLLPPRRMEPMPYKDRDGKRQIDAQDHPGYQWNQVRGLWLIDTTGSKDIDIGHVALFAVGMAQISSVQWDDTGKPNTQVKKGDELGTVSYGGSDYILMFEPGKVHFSSEKGNESPKKDVLYLQGAALVNKI
ncbi:hypothetical protein MANI_011021 [Metarhizium anisopliae]